MAKTFLWQNFFFSWLNLSLGKTFVFFKLNFYLSTKPLSLFGQNLYFLAKLLTLFG
jgi:hypothetical protein